MNEDKRAEALRLAKEAGFDVPDTAESWPKMEHLIALANLEFDAAVDAAIAAIQRETK